MMEEFFGKVDPIFSKEEFMRKVWVSFAKDDVPFDVFKEDCAEIDELHHRVLLVRTAYRTAWSAEIGNDRQESYVDFETYYEKIPYTDYEDKYNSSTGRTERVAVTKYRQEQRQRQVTRYRTVTDWHSGNGEYSDKVYFFDTVDTGKGFDMERFRKDYDTEAVVQLSGNALKAYPEMVLTDAMLKVAYAEQESRIELDTQLSIAGDHVRGFHYRTVEFNPYFASLVWIPEYKTQITYAGKIYVVRGFPIGNMTLSDTKIPNDESADSYAGRKRAETKRENDIRNAEIAPYVWENSKVHLIGSVAAVAACVVFSLFADYLWLMITSYVGAFALIIVSLLRVHAFRKSKTEEINALNDAASAECEEAIKNFRQKHREEVLKALNNKLVSLGLPPAQLSEI